jgi:hypothetical protein
MTNQSREYTALQIYKRLSSERAVDLRRTACTASSGSRERLMIMTSASSAWNRSVNAPGRKIPTAGFYSHPQSPRLDP